MTVGGLLGVAVAVAAAVAAALAMAVPAGAADSTAAPDRLAQPPRDGCQRNAVGLLSNTSAHWTYVYRDNPGQQFNREAEGIVGATHVAAGDLPQAHDWYDLNFDLAPDAQFRSLTAGESTLHIERESGNTPFFAWPSDGDRAKVWGNWIWDCGHWGPQDITNRDFLLPGQGVTPLDGSSDVRGGESTEFHPWNGIVLRRSNPYLPQVGQTQADVFISSNGTQAAAEARCAKDHPPPPGVGLAAFYGPDFTACDANPGSRLAPVNNRDYSFFVPAPAKPTPDARLSWQALASPAHANGPQEIVTERPDGIEVRVPFTGFGSAGDNQAYAKSFFVGWDGELQRLPARLEVTIKDIVVHHALGEPNPKHQAAAGDPIGRYGLTMEINGFWQYLNDWAPGLDTVLDGQTFAVGHTVGINVAAGQPLNIHVDARECDLPKVNPCPATPEIADDNDDPGTAREAFPSAQAAPGDHTLKGVNYDQVNYEIHYSVRLASPARLGPASEAPPVGGPEDAFGRPLTSFTSAYYPNTGPAGNGALGKRASGGCRDTIPPRSRIARIRATRRRVRLGGRASDHRCRGRGTVSSVTVAIARKSARGCRFLHADGRFAPPTSCLRTVYLPGRGTRRWTFERRLRLPLGRYIAWSRATDAAGNVEHKKRRRNLARFRVRRRR